MSVRIYMTMFVLLNVALAVVAPATGGADGGAVGGAAEKEVKIVPKKDYPCKCLGDSDEKGNSWDRQEATRIANKLKAQPDLVNPYGDCRECPLPSRAYPTCAELRKWRDIENAKKAKKDEETTTCPAEADRKTFPINMISLCTEADTSDVQIEPEDEPEDDLEDEDLAVVDDATVEKWTASIKPKACGECECHKPEDTKVVFSKRATLYLPDIHTTIGWCENCPPTTKGDCDPVQKDYLEKLGRGETGSWTTLKSVCKPESDQTVCICNEKASEKNNPNDCSKCTDGRTASPTCDKVKKDKTNTGHTSSCTAQVQTGDRCECDIKSSKVKKHAYAGIGHRGWMEKSEIKHLIKGNCDICAAGLTAWPSCEVKNKEAKILTSEKKPVLYENMAATCVKVSTYKAVTGKAPKP